MGCFLLHNWTAWERLPGRCIEMRKCQDCGKEQTRHVDHIFGKWQYLQEGNCTQERRCSYCGYSEKRAEHSMAADWHYAAHDSCTYINTCTRCGAMKVQYEKHQYGEWVYETKNSCCQVRICSRCHEKDYRMGKHRWSSARLPLDKCIAYAKKMTGEKIHECNLEREATKDALQKYEVQTQIEMLKKEEQEYELKLETQPDNMLCQFCTRCGFVKNLGLWQEQLDKIISEE